MLISYIIIINGIAFLTCYLDKRKAIKKKYRISEKTLISLSLLGGGLGLFLAMYTFHHKTKHVKFVIGVPITILLWAILLIIERGMI